MEQDDIRFMNFAGATTQDNLFSFQSYYCPVFFFFFHFQSTPLCFYAFLHKLWSFFAYICQPSLLSFFFKFPFSVNEKEWNAYVPFKPFVVGGVYIKTVKGKRFFTFFFQYFSSYFQPHISHAFLYFDAWRHSAGCIYNIYNLIYDQSILSSKFTCWNV